MQVGRTQQQGTMTALVKVLVGFTVVQVVVMGLLILHFHIFDSPTGAGSFVASRPAPPVPKQGGGILSSVAEVARRMKKMKEAVVSASEKKSPAIEDRAHSARIGVDGPAAMAVPGTSIKYHMPSPAPISQQKKRIDIFVGIMAKEGNEHLRASIRKTYKQKFGTRNWKFLFFMAKPRGFLAKAEADKFNDIVFVDVSPEYREEPKIAYAVVHAATQVAGSPDWVIKSDENTYISYDTVLKTLRNGGSSMRKNYFGGSPVVGNKPIRDQNSQFYESVKDLPSATFGPYNSAAGGYVLSIDLCNCVVGKLGKGDVSHMHSHDVAMGEMTKKCGAKPVVFPNHKDIMFPGINNAAGFLKADKDSQAMQDMIPYQWNKRAAELVGMVRQNARDTRSAKCKRNPVDASKITLDTSIIITLCEEQPTVLVRTLRTILKNSPKKLVKEIILVDDGSKPEYWKQLYPFSFTPRYHPTEHSTVDPNKKLPLLEYLKAISPKVKYLKQARNGFIRARVAGIKMSTAATFTIMESHSEPVPGWLEALLWELQKNPKTMANPVITQIHHHSFAQLNPVYQVMTYNYLFEMKWGELNSKFERTKDHIPFNSPVHAGGIYAIKRSFYDSLLGYDPLMRGFSSENLDLAFQVWMCNGGGRNIVVPCSHVGHVYRDKSPAASIGLFNSHNVNLNKKILIDSWLRPGKFRNDVLKERHHDLDNFKVDDTKALEARKEWIKSHCKDFDWFFKRVSVPTHNK